MTLNKLFDLSHLQKEGLGAGLLGQRQRSRWRRVPVKIGRSEHMGESNGWDARVKAVLEDNWWRLWKPLNHLRRCSQYQFNIPQPQSSASLTRQCQVFSKPKRSQGKPVRMECLSPWQLSSADELDSSWQHKQLPCPKWKWLQRKFSSLSVLYFLSPHTCSHPAGRSPDLPPPASPHN